MVACWIFLFAKQKKQNKIMNTHRKIEVRLNFRNLSPAKNSSKHLFNLYFQSCWNNWCCPNMSVRSCKDSITKLNSFYSTGSCRWNTWSIKCIIRWIIKTGTTKEIMYNYFKKKTSGMLIYKIFVFLIFYTIRLCILVEVMSYIWRGRCMFFCMCWV